MDGWMTYTRWLSACCVILMCTTAAAADVKSTSSHISAGQGHYTSRRELQGTTGLQGANGLGSGFSSAVKGATKAFGAAAGTAAAGAAIGAVKDKSDTNRQQPQAGRRLLRSPPQEPEGHHAALAVVPHVPHVAVVPYIAESASGHHDIVRQHLPEQGAAPGPVVPHVNVAVSPQSNAESASWGEPVVLPGPVEERAALKGAQAITRRSITAPKEHYTSN